MSSRGSYNDLRLIGVLKQLRRFLRGAPATVIWDNLPSHHSHVMGAWLAGQRHWLAVEFLSGYAHDLNPVEGLGQPERRGVGQPVPRHDHRGHRRCPAGDRPGLSESTLLFSFLRRCGLEL
jgi:hypothetical protein